MGAVVEVGFLEAQQKRPQSQVSDEGQGSAYDGYLAEQLASEEVGYLEVDSLGSLLAEETLQEDSEPRAEAALVQALNG